ncbi:hypothetical protein RYZ20_02730 [Thioclava sp. A2]|uniref:hypothetical protein n=1 Tax=Thioclava sp. FCG-A2 TaxID=3080562 RepID=UPI00295319EA|nr:hypothetical protein [Thioclava sp. A2]MDV7269809.1 hypothetical protein [Thioclava sp. A2]
MNGDELLNTSTSDLANYYACEFEFDVPTILDTRSGADFAQDQTSQRALWKLCPGIA